MEKRYSYLIKPLQIIVDVFIINFVVYFTSDKAFLNVYFLSYITVFWFLTSYFFGFYKVYRYTRFLRLFRLLGIRRATGAIARDDTSGRGSGNETNGIQRHDGYSLGLTVVRLECEKEEGRDSAQSFIPAALKIGTPAQGGALQGGAEQG